MSQYYLSIMEYFTRDLSFLSFPEGTVIKVLRTEQREDGIILLHLYQELMFICTHTQVGFVANTMD